jgi:hypothetical protein
VRFEVFMAEDDDDVPGFWCHVDSLVDVNVSERHTVSIFSAEVGLQP